MHKSLALILLALAPAPAPAAAQSATPVGRTFHYERTNLDGSQPEQIWFHRTATDRLEVYKMVRRCTQSALVSAAFDPRTGEAVQLVAARLLPKAQAIPYAWVNFDARTRQLSGRIALPGLDRPLVQTVQVRPWHQYDLDLATLAAAFQARPGSRAPMRFGLSLFWRDPAEPDTLLHWLGAANARFAAAETHLDRAALRFEVTGPAFGKDGGGPLWVDAADGTLLDVQWGRPNHDNYSSFRLRLIEETAPGAQAWTERLASHFEGCPPPSPSDD